MTVAYTEIERFPREEGNIFQGGKYTRRLKCAWNDRYTLVNDLLETYWPYGTGNGAVAHEYAIEPFPNSRMSGTNDLASYDHALVTIFYDDKVYLFNANAVSEEIVPWERSERIGGNGIFWNTGSDYYQIGHGEAPSHNEVGFSYIFTYHRLYLYQVNPAWISYTGYVNGATMTANILGMQFARDTMLYKGMKMRHSVTPGVATRTVSCSLQFDYIYRGGLGWQSFWRPETGQYETIYNADGTQRLQYPRGVFAF